MHYLLDNTLEKITDIEFPVKVKVVGNRPDVPDWACYAPQGEKQYYFVYKIWLTGSRDGKYFGKTNNVYKRLKEHVGKSTPKQPIDYALRELGNDNFTFYIMGAFLSNSEAVEYERFLIKKHNAHILGFNRLLT